MNIGVLGGGQLGRMLALAGLPLGLRFVFLDPNEAPPAAVAGTHLRGEYDDPAALERLAQASDIVTFEFENVSPEPLAELARQVPVFPSIDALSVARDRLHEKRLFQQLGIPTAPFAPADSLEGLKRALERVGLPAVVKTRRMGYDGKGQRLVKRLDEADEVWAALGGVALIVEGFVRFRREVSLLAVRGRTGEKAYYPLSENTHRQGILEYTLVRPGDPRQAQAEAHGERLLAALDYVGVLACEFFDTEDGLVANEIAPRVHNSGHWTIEGAQTSQFENHLRAILGLPLGGTAARSLAAMVNFVGTLPPVEKVLAIPGSHLHVYGKEARPGRKLGHATVRGDDPAQVELGLAALRALVA